MEAERKSNKKILVLMDAHALLHRAFHALPNFTSPKGEPTGALYGFVSTLFKIIKEFKPDYLVACYDLPEPTFRHAIYDDYKAKRPKMDAELVSQIKKSKLILENFGVPLYEAPGFEADDLLSTIVEILKPKKSAGKTEENKNLKIVIVTGDLDTLQLVRKDVEVYTMKKGIQDSVIYDNEAVVDRFGFGPELLPDFKGLRGDPSDNIIGIKGIGEKTAQILIQKFGSLEKIYKKLKKDRRDFEIAGIKARILDLLTEGEEEAFFSKTLAETRKDAPVEFFLEKAEWSPDLKKEKITELFKELGFRTLMARAEAMFFSPEKITGREIPPDLIDKDMEKKSKLAFWILDSRRVNPEMKDILAEFGGSVGEAEKKMEERIKEGDMGKIFYDIELPLAGLLEKMEKIGILLDVDYLKELSLDYNKRLKQIEKKIWDLSGEEFNISSPKQMSEILFKKLNVSSKGVRKTGLGVLSTRFSELEKIKDRHPVVEQVFLYRELAKLVSTYVDNLPKLVDSEGRLHTLFNQTGTTTGRLSSSEPNLQNIPIRTEFGRAVRRAFVAPRGWKLVSFDYSQIELRVAASLSGDEKLRQAFADGKDIHTKVASEVFNVPFDGVDKEMRRRAKVINFGIIYGMGINNLSKNLGCSKEEARIFYDEYFNDFRGVRDYVERVKECVSKNGYTETFFGRRRYLPEINSHIEYLRKEAERMAINAPIQGTGADIIKLAMVKLAGDLPEAVSSEKSRLLLQIHDELVFEIKDDIINILSPEIKKIMEGIELPGVPLIADVSVGDNWRDIKKVWNILE